MRIVQVLIAATAITLPAAAQIPAATPMKGQDAAQTATDQSQCQSAATQASGYVPGTPPPPSTAATGPTGNRAKGAAMGAVAGEAISDDAGKGAAAGVVAGGVANRSQRRQANREQQAATQTQQQQQAAWANSYKSCMSSRGYSVQ